MKLCSRNALFTLVLAAGLAPAALSARAPRAQSSQSAMHAAMGSSYTGVVGDDMCGVKHTMGGSDTDCTHMCVKGGSNYALIVGDKAYTLATTDKKALATLFKLAGKRAVVHGTLNGTTLAVSSVAAPAM